MIQECVFNELTDIQETRPGLACDISEAKEKGYITDVGMTDEYNGFSDPSQVGELVRDVFTQVDHLRELARLHGVKESPSGDFKPVQTEPAATE